MPLIDVHEVTKIYDSAGIETHALRGVSFTVERGEFVSIMGPSGSGKSTLLHILGFLSEETGGSYRFSGKTQTELSEPEIARIRNEEMGFVFQSFNLLPRESVLENVMLPLLYSNRPEKEWRGRAEEAIEKVGLSHRRDFETYKLSGGEKQRTAIARALINDPNVIFADEPTGNLDSKSGGIVMETLQYLHEELGHTVILITHEQTTAEHAERIIYIQDGGIRADQPIKNRRFAKDSYVK